MSAKHGEDKKHEASARAKLHRDAMNQEKINGEAEVNLNA